MRVLLTNYQLATRSGSELYVSDVARALLERGHSPVAYAPVLGRIASELRDLTVPVVDDLRRITEAPDIIHGQHNHEILEALLRFPDTPAVRVCHGWIDEPPQPFPRIMKFVAVDDTVRDRLVSEWGVPPEQIDVVYNFVALERFPARAPLPSPPAHVIVFGNTASDHLSAITRACRDRGIVVETIGLEFGAIEERPAERLRSADIVFARGRCAIEAMAVGAAVVLYGRPGLGPLVTLDAFDRLRAVNFGVRAMHGPVTTEDVAEQLDRYDPGDAAAVSERMRAVGSIDHAVDALLAIYEDAIEQFRASPLDRAAEFASLANYVHGRRPVGSSREAVAALLRAAYFRCRRFSLLRPLMPSTAVALRLRKKLG